MSAEKYVDSVVRKVRCGREKKKEIRRQLLSDITAACEEGESLESIIGRMGSAAEAAEEFNQNLLEAEQKRYRREKRWKIFGCIAVVLVLLLSGIYWFLPKTYELSKGGYFDGETVEARMQEVIAELDRGDYEAMQAKATEEMKPMLTAEYMESARGTVSDDWGTLEAYGTVYAVQVKQQRKRYAVGQITVGYENVSVTYTLTFDEDMKLAGLYIR